MLAKDLRPIVVARQYLPHILLFSVWNAIVMVVHTVGHHPTYFGLPDDVVFHRIAQTLVWSDVGLPFSAIAALGGALAIFLGFRNKAAYDRWWEARKVWGALVNESRSFTRQVLAWVRTPTDEATRALQVELVHRHLAFVHGLAHHLRGQRGPLLTVTRSLVPSDEADRYEQVPNVITALLLTQGRRVAECQAAGHLDEFRHLWIDNLLTRLSDVQGKCERIKNTPLPRQYDAFPRWFVFAYAMMLPFGLVEPIGWGAVPVAAFISVLFVALEVSGRSIEDPFENTPMDTPMTALATTIERDLRAALDEPLPPPAVPDERGVLM